MTWWRRMVRRRAFERELDAELEITSSARSRQASAPDDQKPTRAARCG